MLSSFLTSSFHRDSLTSINDYNLTKYFIWKNLIGISECTVAEYCQAK